MDWLTPEVTNGIFALLGAILGTLGGRNTKARQIHNDPTNNFRIAKLDKK